MECGEPPWLDGRKRAGKVRCVRTGAGLTADRLPAGNPITQKILSLMGIGYFVTTPPQPAAYFTAENENQVQG